VFLLFCGQKTPLENLSGQKREVSVNVRRLGEELAFKTLQPEPKLN